MSNKKDDKETWLATHHCTPAGKIHYSCGSTSQYASGEKRCPAYYDPNFTEVNHFQEEIKAILKSKRKK